MRKTFEQSEDSYKKMEIPFEYLVLALLVAIAYFWRVGYIGGSGGMFAREPSNSRPAFSVPLPEFSAGDVHQYFRHVRRVQDANGISIFL